MWFIVVLLWIGGWSLVKIEPPFFSELGATGYNPDGDELSKPTRTISR
jgi:hypothetical protein